MMHTGDRLHLWLAAILLAACLLTSCVGNCAYRSKDGGCSATPLPHYMRETVAIPGVCCEGPSYRLAFIEFDDRGEMFDVKQLNQAVEAIRAAKADAEKLKTGANIVVFIHGWKNNASDKSGNVWGFRRSLKNIVREWPATPTVGIYFGWRGDVLRPGFLKQLTIRDRGEKSRNLPNAHTTEALLSVMMEAKGQTFQDRTNRLILIGHSFGGAVLESALTQTLVNQIMRGHRGENKIAPLADLIVYINQAAAANVSYQTLELLKRHKVKFASDRSDDNPDLPLILNIASESDSATGIAFPGSQLVFFRARNSLRKYPEGNPFGFRDQKRLFYQTTAHLGALHSHTIRQSPLMAAKSPAEVAAAQAARLNIRVDGSCYDVASIPQTTNDTPYWVAHLPSRIVPDHSTIFTPQFENFLTGVILRSVDIQAYQTRNQDCIPSGKRPSPAVQQQYLTVQ